MTIWRVTATALNLREKPARESQILGVLKHGSQGRFLAESQDGMWLELEVDGKIGWCWEGFLEVFPEAADGLLTQMITSISDIVDHSTISQYYWAERGIAPSAYLRGMGLAYLQAK